MSLCVFSDFDAAFSIIRNYVSSDVGLTVRTKNYNSIEGALLNLVPPNERHRTRAIVSAYNLDSIVM